MTLLLNPTYKQTLAFERYQREFIKAAKACSKAAKEREKERAKK